MTQLSLFDESRNQAGLRLTPSARLSDPETSREAAAAHPSARINLREDVYGLLQLHPDGLTDWEIALELGRHQPSVGKRRGELVEIGVVEFAGIWRLSPLGSRCRVWKVVP